MTNYTQKKQHTQNTTTKMLGLNAHTGLRAGLSEQEWGEIFACTKKKGNTWRSCVQDVVSKRPEFQSN